MIFLALQTVVNELWLSRGISTAVDYPRVHHQLFPNTVMGKVTRENMDGQMDFE